MPAKKKNAKVQLPQEWTKGEFRVSKNGKVQLKVAPNKVRVQNPKRKGKKPRDSMADTSMFLFGKKGGRSAYRKTAGKSKTRYSPKTFMSTLEVI